MKKGLFFLAVLATGNLMAQIPLQQGAAIPQNSVIYALPSTVIEIQVEAIREIYTAGPYARYAQKYLGVEADVNNRETYVLKSIAMQESTEADLSQVYSLEIKDKSILANFLSFSENGLVVSPEYGSATPLATQMPTNTHEPFRDRGVESAISQEKVTLYRASQADGGLDKVPVQQSQAVEKNPERRAEEAANVIFNLRKKRIELISGDIDGALSHDGLRAALDEMQRIEDEYLSLFIGKKTTATQSSVFYVSPVANQQKQLYVAFRFSDTQGLLPSDDVSGRPITLELSSNLKGSNSQSMIDSNPKTARIAYRTPAATQARLSDGQNTLLQKRLKVYQFGPILSLPATIQVK